MTKNKIDNDWLMVEHYRKLDKKSNPHNLSCKMCMKTHFPKHCPYNDAKEERPIKELFYYNQDSWSSTYDDENYGH